VARTIGVEVETIGLSLENVARAVQSVVGGTATRRTDPDDPSSAFWIVEAADDRAWKVEDDDSLQVPADQRAEVVSPILYEADFGLLIRVIDAVRSAGATVNSYCGVHVHIGTASCTVENLNRAIDILIVLEPIVIERMLGISEHRRQFASLMSRDFIEAFQARRPASFEQLWALWGGPGYDEQRRRDRFDVARYNGLNLHSHDYRGTIEFRYFNGTVDAQKIVEYVRLCLGVAEQAGFPVPSQEDL
jgi:hypothetical protein